ncbi:hypothetical protein [Thiomicrorhabdus sp.]|uniref:hypothetical protein n=1 Tax=Thiomicrorhabdus sp. TaxID=2039724 RepID=UPI002AA7E3C4|nr:hypothetical protein [Thiomicrorhabdus sp.]
MKMYNLVKKVALGSVLSSVMVLGVSLNASAEDSVQLNTQQQTQLKTQQQVGPAVPQGNGLNKKQIQNKNMYQHQKTLEGELQKAEKSKQGNGAGNKALNRSDNRTNNRPDNRSFNGNGGSGAMKGAGGGGKR